MLDEPTDGGFHHTVFMIDGTLIGLHEHPGSRPDDTFSELRTGLDHIGFSAAPTDRASPSGRPDSTSSASPTVASSTPTTDQASASKTPTASPSSSSPHQADALHPELLTAVRGVLQRVPSSPRTDAGARVISVHRDDRLVHLDPM